MNPIVLVTGARGGIGRALCAQLQAQGWQVAAVGRDAAALADVPAALHIAADTTTPEGAAAAVAACREGLGLPTRLAHCVGSTLIAPLHRSKPEQMREVLRVNLDSALYMLGAWVEALREPPQPGAAVFVSSVVAGIGVANHEAIAAAKGGIEALVRSAAAAGTSLRVEGASDVLRDACRRLGIDVLLGLVRRGLGGTAGDGRQYISWIHERDFLRAIDFIVEHDDLAGPVNLAAPEPLPNAEFMRVLRQAYGTSIGLPATR